MIIVSNAKVDDMYSRGNENMSYDNFIEKALSDEGLDMNETMIININEVDEDFYEQLKDENQIKFFSIIEEVPSFVTENDLDNILNWIPEDEEIKEEKPNPLLVEDFEIDIPIKKEKEITSSPIVDINKLNGDVSPDISKLLNDSTEFVYNEAEGKDNMNEKDARMVLFGSSKGGTGKTFTSIISAYRYAKTHPKEKVALIDFDIIDGQVGISIHKVKPTMINYYKEYQKGYRDFRTMREFSVKGNKKFPDNLDFYLAPNNGRVIRDDDFWLNIINNLNSNYDVVVFDTGIDYLNIHPISYAYKIADKINIVTTTSIKSVNSVTKMIQKLVGLTPNSVYSEDDEIEPKLNVIITQMIASDEMNTTIYKTLSKHANVIATFGVITDSVSQAEYFGSWDIFDDNDGINRTLDLIME